MGRREHEDEEDPRGEQEPEAQAVGRAVRPRMRVGEERRRPELVHDLPGARVARRGVFPQASLDDPLEDLGGVGTRVPERRRLSLEDRLHQVLERLARTLHERRASRQHLVEHRSEGPQIGARVDLFAAELLRGHEGQGAHGAPRIREAAGPFPQGQAEIEQLHPPAAGQHQIGRLEVAVDDPGAVGRLQRRGELGGDRDDLGQRHGSDLLRPVEPLLEGFAVVERHGQEGLSLVLADLQDFRDVRMVQRRRGPGLAPETFPVDAPHLLRGEQLERHLAAGVQVAGPVHHAHAAAAEQGRGSGSGTRCCPAKDHRPDSRPADLLRLPRDVRA